MRIVLDENLPRPLRRIFGLEHSVETVQGLGLGGTTNGELLARLEGDFDVFVTADKNLRYQQNLSGRSLAIVELPTNRLPILKAMSGEVASAVVSASPGSYVRVPLPDEPSDADGTIARTPSRDKPARSALLRRGGPTILSTWTRPSGSGTTPPARLLGLSTARVGR